jgi:hypothetical protein
LAKLRVSQDAPRQVLVRVLPGGNVAYGSDDQRQAYTEGDEFVCDAPFATEAALAGVCEVVEDPAP